MASDDIATAARTALRERFGGEDGVVVASAPGRVNLIGGHTDYNEGFVLPVAIDRRTAVAVRPRDDRRVRAYSADLDDERTFPLDDHQPPESPEWVDYVRGVVGELRDAGVDGSGLDLVVRGTVPRGAGLSSSAALEVAAAGAVQAARGGDLDREALATLCWRAETEFVGLSCGIMDQYAVACGRRDRALFLDCRERAVEPIPFGDDARIVAVDTNVEHELVDSAYNERVAQCREAVERLGDDVSSLRDLSVEEFERRRDDLPDPVDRRAEHVVYENERVREAARALADGALDRVGALMYDSHGSLRENYEVSCAELDAVVDVARDVDGVLGARMTGAGFGGCVVALVRADATAAFEETVASEYEDRTGVAPDVYPCRTADGYRVHDGER